MFRFPKVLELYTSRKSSRKSPKHAFPRESKQKYSRRNSFTWNLMSRYSVLQQDIERARSWRNTMRIYALYSNLVFKFYAAKKTTTHTTNCPLLLLLVYEMEHVPDMNWIPHYTWGGLDPTAFHPWTRPLRFRLTNQSAFRGRCEPSSSAAKRRSWISNMRFFCFFCKAFR